MKRIQKALRIHRTTLRLLSRDELRAAAGGYAEPREDEDPTSGIISRGCSDSCPFCVLPQLRGDAEP